VRRLAALLIALIAIAGWGAPARPSLEQRTASIQANLEHDSVKQVTKLDLSRVRISHAPLAARVPPVHDHGTQPGGFGLTTSALARQRVWTADLREFAKRSCPWLEHSGAHPASARA
jgi:hypothetical protein